MHNNNEFIQIKEQSKEGVKAFGCLLGFIFICAVAISLIILYKDEIYAAMEVFTNYLNAL